MLMIKVEEGNLKEVQTTRQKFPNEDIDGMNKAGQTALTLAARNGFYSIVKYLISQKADVNATNMSGQTPLFVSCWYNHLEIVKLLVKHNADINLADPRGWTPLMVACQHQNTKLIEYFIKLGADARASDSFGKKARDRVKDPSLTELIDQLDEKQSQIDQTRELTLPRRAVSRGRSRSATKEVSKGALKSPQRANTSRDNSLKNTTKLRACPKFIKDMEIYKMHDNVGYYNYFGRNRSKTPVRNKSKTPSKYEKRDKSMESFPKVDLSLDHNQSRDTNNTFCTPAKKIKDNKNILNSTEEKAIISGQKEGNPNDLRSLRISDLATRETFYTSQRSDGLQESIKDSTSSMENAQGLRKNMKDPGVSFRSLGSTMSHENSNSKGFLSSQSTVRKETGFQFYAENEVFDTSDDDIMSSSLEDLFTLFIKTLSDRMHKTLNKKVTSAAEIETNRSGPITEKRFYDLIMENGSNIMDRALERFHKLTEEVKQKFNLSDDFMGVIRESTDDLIKHVTNDTESNLKHDSKRPIAKQTQNPHNYNFSFGGYIGEHDQSNKIREDLVCHFNEILATLDQGLSLKPENQKGKFVELFTKEVGESMGKLKLNLKSLIDKDLLAPHPQFEALRRRLSNQSNSSQKPNQNYANNLKTLQKFLASNQRDNNSRNSIDLSINDQLSNQNNKNSCVCQCHSKQLVSKHVQTNSQEFDSDAIQPAQDKKIIQKRSHHRNKPSKMLIASIHDEEILKGLDRRCDDDNKKISIDSSIDNKELEQETPKSEALSNASLNSLNWLPYQLDTSTHNSTKNRNSNVLSESRNSLNNLLDSNNLAPKTKKENQAFSKPSSQILKEDRIENSFGNRVANPESKVSHDLKESRTGLQTSRNTEVSNASLVNEDISEKARNINEARKMAQKLEAYRNGNTSLQNSSSNGSKWVTAIKDKDWITVSSLNELPSQKQENESNQSTPRSKKSQNLGNQLDMLTNLAIKYTICPDSNKKRNVSSLQSLPEENIKEQMNNFMRRTLEKNRKDSGAKQGNFENLNKNAQKSENTVSTNLISNNQFGNQFESERNNLSKHSLKDVPQVILNNHSASDRSFSKQENQNLSQDSNIKATGTITVKSSTESQQCNMDNLKPSEDQDKKEQSRISKKNVFGSQMIHNHTEPQSNQEEIKQIELDEAINNFCRENQNEEIQNYQNMFVTKEDESITELSINQIQKEENSQANTSSFISEKHIQEENLNIQEQNSKMLNDSILNQDNQRLDHIKSEINETISPILKANFVADSNNMNEAENTIKSNLINCETNFKSDNIDKSVNLQNQTHQDEGLSRPNNILNEENQILKEATNNIDDITIPQNNTTISNESNIIQDANLSLPETIKFTNVEKISDKNSKETSTGSQTNAKSIDDEVKEDLYGKIANDHAKSEELINVKNLNEQDNEEAKHNELSSYNQQVDEIRKLENPLLASIKESIKEHEETQNSINNSTVMPEIDLSCVEEGLLQTLHEELKTSQISNPDLFHLVETVGINKSFKDDISNPQTPAGPTEEKHTEVIQKSDLESLENSWVKKEIIQDEAMSPQNLSHLENKILEKELINTNEIKEAVKLIEERCSNDNNDLTDKSSLIKDTNQPMNEDSNTQIERSQSQDESLHFEELSSAPLSETKTAQLLFSENLQPNAISEQANKQESQIVKREEARRFITDEQPNKLEAVDIGESTHIIESDSSNDISNHAEISPALKIEQAVENSDKISKLENQDNANSKVQVVEVHNRILQNIEIGDTQEVKTIDNEIYDLSKSTECISKVEEEPTPISIESIESGKILEKGKIEFDDQDTKQSIAKNDDLNDSKDTLESKKSTNLNKAEICDSKQSMSFSMDKKESIICNTTENTDFNISTSSDKASLKKQDEKQMLRESESTSKDMVESSETSSFIKRRDIKEETELESTLSRVNQENKKFEQQTKKESIQEDNVCQSVSQITQINKNLDHFEENKISQETLTDDTQNRQSSPASPQEEGGFDSMFKQFEALTKPKVILSPQRNKKEHDKLNLNNQINPSESPKRIERPLLGLKKQDSPKKISNETLQARDALNDSTNQRTNIHNCPAARGIRSFSSQTRQLVPVPSPSRYVKGIMKMGIDNIPFSESFHHTGQGVPSRSRSTNSHL